MSMGVMMQIDKFSSELWIAFRQVPAYLQEAQNTLARLGRSVADKPRRLREALRERENSLQTLLANSADALVVTNNNHRFVAANPRALDLFGISKSNMREFAIDAFLASDQIRDFDGNGSLLTRQKERHGKCKIRRLDGSFRVAEYVFVAHFTPLRNVSTFRDITPPKLQVAFAAPPKPDLLIF
jgi:PAS domain S-box-containing protein